MMTYDVECADRQTGKPYEINVQAIDAAEAMQKASRAHLVAKVRLASEQPGLTPMGSLPAGSTKVHEELRTLTPQVADAETVRLLRDIEASLRVMPQVHDALKTILEKRLPSRLGQSDIAVAVGLGVVLSIPIGAALCFVLLSILGVLAKFG